MLQILRQWSLGKWRNASTCSLASCMSPAALGKRSAKMAVGSSQRTAICAEVSLANTLRRAAVTIPACAFRALALRSFVADQIAKSMLIPTHSQPGG